MSKRKAVERATEIRNAMIAGMWANTNLDDGKSTRKTALEEIQNNYDETIIRIYNGFKEERDLSEDPFFAAIKVPGEELEQSDSQPVPDRTIEEKLEGVDQE